MNNGKFKTLLLIVFDIVFIAFLYLISLYIISIDNNQFDFTKIYTNTVLPLVVIYIGVYIISKSYGNLWRYANFFDFIKSSLSSIFAGMIFFLVEFLFLKNNIPLVAYVFSLMLIWSGILGSRMLYRGLIRFSKIDKKKRHKRTLIVGAGSAGAAIIDEMEKHPQSVYKSICLVDDNPFKLGKRIRDVKIVGTTNDITYICKKYSIETIVFAIPACDDENRKRILDICASTGCALKTLPSIYSLMEDDKGLMRQMREVCIEDLLGRETISFDDDEVSDYIKDKVVLVTGGGGSIGSELCRQIASFNPKKLIILDEYENNAYDIQQELISCWGDSLDLSIQIASVRDFHKMDSVFKCFRPEIVFHAAAHKHVPLMETNPEEAVKNNIVGTFYTATLSDFYNVQRFVFISTDKAVNPTNIMGATKRCCEMIIQYMHSYSKTSFTAVRFGNVLGSNGSVIPLFKKQIANGGPVTVTDPDIIRYFMTIPEAVGLVLQTGGMAKGGEIFVLDMGNPVKIKELAENLIRLSGYEPDKDIKIVYTGLRPGEKLYEELLMLEEGLSKTNNNRIFIGQQIGIDSKSFIDLICKIKIAADQNDKHKVYTLIKQIVPTYCNPQRDKREFTCDISDINTIKI